MGSNFYDDPYSTHTDHLCEDPRNRIRNYAGYCNQQVDTLLDQLQRELDVPKQKALLKEVITLRRAELPEGLGVFVPRFYAFRGVVKDFRTDEDQNLVWASGGLHYAWLNR